jgi:hypothetical protein
MLPVHTDNHPNLLRKNRWYVFHFQVLQEY